MVVLGICPGLNALAYCVLSFGTDGATPIDADMLYCRPLTPEAARDLKKRCRVHHLVLGVVAERYAPGWIAIGPAADATEEPDHVAAMADVLVAMARGYGASVVELRERAQILQALDTREQSIGRKVHRSLTASIGSRDRRIIWAAAAALAARSVKRAP